MQISRLVGGLVKTWFTKHYDSDTSSGYATLTRPTRTKECLQLRTCFSFMDFRQPNLVDRMVNHAFGYLLKLGIGLSHNYLLEVRGRKTGKVYSTPVNVLEYKGKKYLVAPRGYTQWVRNVEASGEATLVRGTRRERVELRALADEGKAEVLKVYLDRFKPTVQRYFPVAAGSPVDAFAPLTPRYPVFELTP